MRRRRVLIHSTGTTSAGQGNGHLRALDVGIAVDHVGNIFIVEQGAGRINLISYDGIKFAWITDTTDPQFLAFTQY